MPTYIFYDTRKKKQFEEFLSIAAKEQYLKDNPHIQQILSPLPISRMGFGGLDSKTDNTWKEVLSKIAEQNPSSNLADRYGSRSIKQIKTKQAIEKHTKKQKELKQGR